MKNQNLFRSLIAIATLSAALHVEAASFKRFWRGYARTDLSASEFVRDVNGKIIPATRELFNKASGLLSYQPVITNDRSTRASTEIAEEFALLQYESEAAYRNYRSTPEGVAYGDLHWEMFDSTRSKSTVVENYTGRTESGHAYDLFGRNVDWKKLSSHFVVYARDAGISETEFLETAHAQMNQDLEYGADYGLRAAILLVMPDHVVVYEAWDSATAREEYVEALSADMPHGEPTLRETAYVMMSIRLQSHAHEVRPG